MIYMYFYLLFVFFLICLMMGVMFYYMSIGVMLEWLFVSSNSMNMEFYILIDWMSLIFMSLIVLISSFILIYSAVYMSGDKNIERFIYLVMLFILSMLLMVISPNMISILFGWDGLGVISYCLVIYYQNYMSYNSGMITVLSNRVGDVGLLMGIGLLMYEGSWGFMNYYQGWGPSILLVMVMLAAITKSAQLPFSVWLPLAMAAPTPVSALVHSSTLVTAGVYLLIRYNVFLVDNKVGCMYMIFMSVLTSVLFGFLANFENDLKKIVALSTLSQLGIMMVALSAGFKMMAFYHLLVHAIFKSMLFMSVGVIIHLMKGVQDIRLMGGLVNFLPFIMISFMISVMSLGGIPFMAGFYSKDFIMELMLMNNLNLMVLMMIIMSLMFTISYSLRLMYYVFLSSINFNSCIMIHEDKGLNFSMMILMILSVIFGSAMNWLFFFDYYMVMMSVEVKMILYLSLMIGVMLGVIFIKMNFLNVYYMYMYMSSSMYLNYIYQWIYKPMMEFSKSMGWFDKTWNEMLNSKLIINWKSWGMNFKMNMFILIFIYVILLSQLIW